MVFKSSAFIMLLLGYQFIKYIIYFYLSAKQGIVVYACDCSSEVLEIAKEAIYSTNLVLVKHRFHPFLLDFSVNAFPDWFFCTNCQSTSFTKPVDFPSGTISNYE